MGSLAPRLLLATVFGLMVFLGLTLYANLGGLLGALASFRWELLPIILGLSLFNYSLRFLKWHYLLGQAGVRGLDRGLSGLVFMSGLAMVVTPWGLGQWLKSYLLNQARGTPFSHSAPVVVAERVTDALGMAVLALGGLVSFRLGWAAVAPILLLTALLTGVVRYRPLGRVALRAMSRLPFCSRRTEDLGRLYQSSYSLFSVKNLLAGTALSAVSWLAECLGFYLTLRGLGVQAGPVTATFIFAISMLAGSLLFLPGGLGVAEGGLAGLSQLLLGVSRETAAAGTLIIRLATLWFAVGLGAVALLITLRRLGMTRAAIPPMVPLVKGDDGRSAPFGEGVSRGSVPPALDI